MSVWTLPVVGGLSAAGAVLVLLCLMWTWSQIQQHRERAASGRDNATMAASPQQEVEQCAGEATREGTREASPGDDDAVPVTVTGCVVRKQTPAKPAAHARHEGERDEVQTAARGNLPPVDRWRTRPFMLRVNCGERVGEMELFNEPTSVFPVETEYFVGKVYFRLRGLPGEPTSYFNGKNRWTSTVVQGRVKKPIPMSECATGYEFGAPFTHVPSRLLIRAALSFVRSIAPTMSVDLLGERPNFLNPLFQTIQRLHVALPGSEPPITEVFEEKTSLLGGVFANKTVGWKERKKFFASRSHGAKFVLDPAHVYTMEFYEDKLIPATFELAILGMKFPLSRYLGGGSPRPQPLQILGKVGFEPHNGQYLFNVEMWHEALFAGSGGAAESSAITSPTIRAHEQTSDASPLYPSSAISSHNVSIDVQRSGYSAGAAPPTNGPDGWLSSSQGGMGAQRLPPKWAWCLFCMGPLQQEARAIPSPVQYRAAAKGPDVSQSSASLPASISEE